MSEHFKLLGFRVEDVISGFKGVVTAVHFDLYGCVQALVHPGTDDKGVLKDVVWFDMKRLKALSTEAVMPLPTFEFVPGGETPPKFPSIPRS